MSKNQTILIFHVSSTFRTVCFECSCVCVSVDIKWKLRKNNNKL